MEPTQPLPGELAGSGRPRASRVFLAESVPDLQRAAATNGVQPAARRPAGQPVIHLDGEPVTALTTKQSNDLSKRAGVHTAVVGQVVQYLAADEKLFALSIAELADAVKLINGFHRQLQSGEPVTDVSDFARIARLMVTDLAAPQELGSQLRSATSVQVSGPQARAVLSFLGCYPRFADMLTGTQDGQYGVKVVFGRPEAKKYGDGVYKDGVVKLAPLDTESPYTFLRLLLHEIGHATLERLLLDRKEPPLILDNGTFSTLMTRRAELTALLQRPAPVDQPTRLVRQQAATELAEIEKTIQASGVKPFGEAMSSDGMCFYDAWLVLRKDHGAKLCGLDLGNGRQPADRRNYQAGKFSEFCAEVFMQAATGEVAAHVRTLAADADTPAAVLDAWKDVVRVLLKYRPIILGG